MLPLLVFLAVAGGSTALYLALADAWKPGRAHLRRRLAGEAAPAEPTARRLALYKETPEWNAEPVTRIDPERPAIETRKALPRKSPAQRLKDFLREAGFPMAPRRLIAINLGTALVTGLLTALATDVFAAVILFVLAAAAPWVFLNIRRNQRRDRYVKQLANAFDLMARVLRSGQPVQEAFRAAVKASDEPLASEFGRCQHQIEHGIRPEEAYRELNERAPVLELRIFIVAMNVQRQTGGSLTEVLERLAVLVRTRMKLKQKLRALTAEGRMQSATLTALPFVTFFVMYFLNRSYAEQLLTQWKLLLATGVCMLVGVVWIRNIMKFEG